ncbi:MAG: DUF134 domain-containing protein [Candidatus Odinarchaeota archaeon]
MPRPYKRRFVRAEPNVTYYKPRGIPIGTIGEVVLNIDEFEALRVKDHLGLPQKEAAQQLKVSQPTLHRILKSAHAKVAHALVNGMALRIDGGPYDLPKVRWFRCFTCQTQWTEPFGTGRPEVCPRCDSHYLRRLAPSEIGEKQSDEEL